MRKYGYILSLVVLLMPLILGSIAESATVQKITITMREYTYTPSQVTVAAGTPVEITLVNKGRLKHEFMLYGMPKAGMMGMEFHKWADDHSYFHGMRVAVEGRGIEVERKHGVLVEVQLGVGKSATVKFTPKLKGTFEFACLIAGHYEAGQKGVLVVK